MQPGDADAGHAHHRSLHALAEARGQLQKWVLKLLGYALLAFLLLRLTPSLKHAFDTIAHLEWQWLVGMLALETLSEIGLVGGWRAIGHRDKVLERHGPGHRLPSRVARGPPGRGLLL